MFLLVDLISEIAKKRGTVSLIKGKQSISSIISEYNSVWDSFNRYISAALHERKTVHVSNFCYIGWNLTCGKIRPFFSFTESFCRCFNLNDNLTKKLFIPILGTDVAPIDEFNFSKAAIRYSDSLTKDQVYTGLKYIIQIIGEYFSTGRPIAIDFECGKLIVCPDGGPSHFDFRANFYKHAGLAIPVDADEGNYSPSISFQQKPTEDALTLKVVGNKDIVKNESNISTYVVPPSSEVMSDINSIKSHLIEKNNKSIESEYEYKSEDDDDSAVLENNDSNLEISNSSKSSVAKRREATLNKALDRHVNDIEKRAFQSIRERKEWEDYLHDSMNLVRREMVHRKLVNTDNQKFIKDQINWNVKKKIEDRKNWIDGASSHDFPKFSEPPAGKLAIIQKKIQEKIRNDLTIQKDTSKALIELSKQKDKQLELGQIEFNKIQMFKQRHAEQSRKQAENQALSQSWNRDIHIKNIWNSIDSFANCPMESKTYSNLVNLVSPMLNNSYSAKSIPLAMNNDDCHSVISTASKKSERRKKPINASNIQRD